MVLQKLSWLRRTLGRIGKRVYFWRSQKMNLLLVTSIVQSVIDEYREIHEGNLPKALETLAEGAELGAADIVTDLIGKPIMLGTSMKFVLSKHLPDIALQIWWTLWSLVGKDAGKIFGKPKFIPSEETEDGTAKVVTPIKQCMMCATKPDITPEDLGNQDYFHVITALAGAAVQHVQDYVGNEYKVECRETKCFLRGDNQGEITLFFHSK